MSRPPPPPPDPPAAELAARCAAIRAGWSAEVERARRADRRGMEEAGDVPVLSWAKLRGYRPDRGPMHRVRDDDEW